MYLRSVRHLSKSFLPKDIALIGRTDTAICAKDIGNEAVIASAQAAKLYGLSIIAPSVENDSSICTRYALIRSAPNAAKGISNPFSQQFTLPSEPHIFSNENEWKVSLIVQMQNRPGTISKILSGLALRDIKYAFPCGVIETKSSCSITKLETRPSKRSSGGNASIQFEYLLHLDIAGSLYGQSQETIRVQRAIEQIFEFSHGVAILGCFPRLNASESENSFGRTYLDGPFGQ